MGGRDGDRERDPKTEECVSDVLEQVGGGGQEANLLASASADREEDEEDEEQDGRRMFEKGRPHTTV